MALDIRIRQKGLFKKALTLEDMTGGTLKYGIHDNAQRLKKGSLDGSPVIFYDPAHIGRGVETNWQQGIKDNLCLRLPLPSSAYDCDLVCDIVRRVSGKWSAGSFLQDDTPCRLEDISRLFDRQKEFNLSWMAEAVHTLKDMDMVTLSGAVRPMDISTAMLAEFGRTHDAEGFASYLHAHQAADLYYASAAIYRDRAYPGQYLGVYTITSTVNTIIPLEPYVPFRAENPETGDELTCSRYLAALFSAREGKMIGQVSFDEFSKAVGLGSLEKFDMSHVILPGLSEENMRNIAAQHSIP